MFFTRAGPRHSCTCLIKRRVLGQMLSAVLGKDLQKIESSKVLVVGAGGIGCELLKNLVLSGFKDISIVDLDTIDLSNLNRQFLFSKKNIKKSKAMIARSTALLFNPDVNITAYHASIFELQFSLDFFKSFDLVMNALDNVAARRHVNGMCLAASIPLIESGTAGYLGQVSLHLPSKTKCYDCDPKPSTRKTFPVCTIRSTPSESIHCIVWAKSYLFSHLFGADDDDQVEIKEEGSADDGNFHVLKKEKEIQELKKEALALKELKDGLGKTDHYKVVFEKVYKNDIVRLLKMEELWKTRQKPVPLDIDSFEMSNQGYKGSMLEWDQKPWSMQETVNMFKESLSNLSNSLMEQRKINSVATLSFDKDDEDALNFVTAAANIRAHIFGIQPESRFKVKEMAGNIIPAIATTNAIIAGMIVMLAFKVLAGKSQDCKNTYLAYGGDRRQLLTNEQLESPSPTCHVCSNTYLQVELNTEKVVLGFLIDEIVQNSLNIPGEITVEEGSRLLYDIEFDDNRDVCLKDLGIANGSRLIITNDYEDDPIQNYCVVLMIKDSNINLFNISGSTQLKTRPTVVPTDNTPESLGNKRKRTDDQVEENNKKLKEILVDDNDTIIL